MVPISHVSENLATKMSSAFSGQKVFLSLDSMKSGTNRKLEVGLGVAAFDFESDEELFALLPLKENYKVVIPFYQPGTNRPAKYYVYEVTGTEFINLPDGSKMECWKIQSHIPEVFAIGGFPKIISNSLNSKGKELMEVYPIR